MPLIQVSIIVFVLFVGWRTVSRFRSGELNRLHLVLWLLLWLAVGVAGALPQTTSWLAGLIGVGRGVDAVIYLSLLVLFYLVFRLYVRLERIEHDITLLVRQISLKEYCRHPEACDRNGLDSSEESRQGCNLE